MKLKIIVTLLIFSSVGLFGQSSKPIEFDENVGIQFMKLKKKIKLDKPYSKDVYSLKFLEKRDISEYGFYGLNMIDDLKVIKKEKKNNYFTYSSSFLWKNCDYKESNTALKYGYVYEVRKINDLSVIFDTMIIYIDQQTSGSGSEMESTFHPYAFLMSDYKKRYQTMIDYTYGGHEKLVFPDDSLYVIGLSYNVDYNYYWGVGLDNPMINSLTYVVSNTKDLLFIKENVLKLSEDDYRHVYLDSAWIEKSIYKDKIYNNTINIFDLVSSKQSGKSPNVNNELGEMKSKYQNISYWQNWAKDYHKEKLVTSTGDFSLVFKNGAIYYSFREGLLESDGNEILNQGDEKILFYQKENSVKINNRKIEDLETELDNRFLLSTGSYENPFSAGPSAWMNCDNVYGKDNFNILNLFAVQALNQYNYSRITAEEKKKEIEKEEREIRKASKKYGKKYVDAALDFDIIVGMHEDLLPYPLKLWTIKSRSDFKNGYDLYLYSMLDTSVHLYITVRNHKVSYVSVW